MYTKNIAGVVFGFVKKYPFILFVAFTGWLVSSAFHSRPTAHPTWESAIEQEHAIAEDTEPQVLAELDKIPVKDTLSLRLPDLPDNKEVIAIHLPNNGKREFSGTDKKLEDLIEYALSLQGTPYRYGGLSTDGFDCSGFVNYVFDRQNIELNRSSRTQALQGEEVSLANIHKGDLLFFTGTNPKKREVGHVGIVCSEPGEPVRFVHSSSNGGVKVSDLSGYYDTRYMFARRML